MVGTKATRVPARRQPADNRCIRRADLITCTRPKWGSADNEAITQLHRQAGPRVSIRVRHEVGTRGSRVPFRRGQQMRFLADAWARRHAACSARQSSRCPKVAHKTTGHAPNSAWPERRTRKLPVNQQSVRCSRLRLFLPPTETSQRTQAGKTSQRNNPKSQDRQHRTRVRHADHFPGIRQKHRVIRRARRDHTNGKRRSKQDYTSTGHSTSTHTSRLNDFLRTNGARVKVQRLGL